MSPVASILLSSEKENDYNDYCHNKQNCKENPKPAKVNGLLSGGYINDLCNCIDREVSGIEYHVLSISGAGRIHILNVAELVDVKNAELLITKEGRNEHLYGKLAILNRVIGSALVEYDIVGNKNLSHLTIAKINLAKQVSIILGGKSVGAVNRVLGLNYDKVTNVEFILLGNDRPGSILNGKGCSKRSKCLVVNSIVNELCGYVVNAYCSIAITGLVVNGNTCGKSAADGDGVSLAVVGNGNVIEGHCGNVKSRLLDSPAE